MVKPVSSTYSPQLIQTPHVRATDLFPLSGTDPKPNSSGHFRPSDCPCERRVQIDEQPQAAFKLPVYMRFVAR